MSVAERPADRISTAPVSSVGSAAEVFERTVSLIPALRERAALAEEAREMPPRPSPT